MMRLIAIALRALTLLVLCVGTWAQQATPAAPSGAASATPASSADTPQGQADAAYARGDHATALRLFRTLAQAGDPIAQFNMGVMLDFGQGTAPDAAQAAQWYRRAAVQGHPAAQFNLGGMYLDGAGVPQDLQRAAMWFALAATAGVPGAAKNRAAVAQMITPEQAAQASRRASACQQSGFRDCD